MIAPFFPQHRPQEPGLPLRLLPIPMLLAAGSALGGQVETDRQVVDFGVVGLHAQADSVVMLTNHADRPVRFGAAGSNCICLASRPEKKMLAPGESCEWRVELTTCDYTGSVRREVWLETDDPNRPRLTLRVHYEVRPLLYVEAPFVSAGLLHGNVVEAPVQIHTTGNDAIRITGVSDHPQASVGIMNPVITRERPGSIRVFCSAAWPGPWRERIWVLTDSHEMPRLEIALVGETIYGLRSSERELRFDPMEPGQTAEAAIRFMPEPGVEIGSVRASNDSVQVHRMERAEGAVRVTLRSSERLEIGSFSGFLILEVLEHGESRQVRLPYYGRVSAPAGAAVGAELADLKKP